MQSIETFATPVAPSADLRFTFERKHAGDLTPYYLQGDEELHRTLPSAQRAALRHDPRVLKELEKFWAVFRAHESISKPEYLSVHSKFATVLIPDLSPDEVHDTGEEDWEADAGPGAERMSQEQFMNCLFECARAHTQRTLHIGQLDLTWTPVTVAHPHMPMASPPRTPKPPPRGRLSTP